MIPGNHGRRCSLYSGVCVLLTMHALSHMHTHTCIHARTRTHTHNTRIGPTCVHTHYFSHTHIHTHTYTHRWVGYWCADMSTRIKQSKVTNVISFLSHTHAHTYIHTHTHTGGRDIGAPTCQTRIKAITSNECNFFSPFQFFFGVRTTYIRSESKHHKCSTRSFISKAPYRTMTKVHSFHSPASEVRIFHKDRIHVWCSYKSFD